jgi:tetratricopeptide (TPR) repeat protein
VQHSTKAREELAPTNTRESAENASRKISDAALVAKVYYNRGVVLLDQQRFARAVAVTQAALSLDPADERARKNLLAAYNNWALSLCQRGDFADAAHMVIHALEIGPDFAPLVSNDLHIHQQWVLHLCDNGQFAEALTVLQRGYRRRPDAELFDRGRDTVRRWWAESLETVLTSHDEMDYSHGIRTIRCFDDTVFVK